MLPHWLAHTWWTHRGAPNDAYHWFNLGECLFWLWCAGIVFTRYLKHRHARERWYAFSFVAFALTDLREAYALQTWLIVVKALNLAAILFLRARLRPLYPGQLLMP